MRLRFLLVGILLMAGCTHINQSAFRQLDVGMNVEDVEGILGKPTKCREELVTTACVWQDKDREIRVNYVNKQVVVFSASGLQ
ncbi:MAG: hypothetical protein ACR2PT_17290 [Endozoicomonas sp.]